MFGSSFTFGGAPFGAVPFGFGPGAHAEPGLIAVIELIAPATVTVWLRARAGGPISLSAPRVSVIDLVASPANVADLIGPHRTGVDLVS